MLFCLVVAVVKKMSESSLIFFNQIFPDGRLHVPAHLCSVKTNYKNTMITTNKKRIDSIHLFKIREETIVKRWIE